MLTLSCSNQINKTYLLENTYCKMTQFSKTIKLIILKGDDLRSPRSDSTEDKTKQDLEHSFSEAAEDRLGRFLRLYN